jgi:hypothetical protein
VLVGGDDVGAVLKEKAGGGGHDPRPVRAGDQQPGGSVYRKPIGWPIWLRIVA